MKRISFEKLNKDPFYHQIIKLFESRCGTPLQDNVRQFFVNFVRWSEVEVEQKKQWLDDTKDIVQRICNKTANTSDFSLFWIRLYSIVSEFYNEVRQQSDIYNKSCFKAVIDSLNTLIAEFSEDEISFIQYMRHCNAHLHQSYIHARPKIKNGVISDVKPPQNSTAGDIAKKILSAHSLNEQEVAREYAERIKKYIDILATDFTLTK